MVFLSVRFHNSHVWKYFSDAPHDGGAIREHTWLQNAPTVFSGKDQMVSSIKSGVGLSEQFHA